MAMDHQKHLYLFIILIMSMIIFYQNFLPSFSISNKPMPKRKQQQQQPEEEQSANTKEFIPKMINMTIEKTNSIKILILIPSIISHNLERMQIRTSYAQCSYRRQQFPIAIRFYVGKNGTKVNQNTWLKFHNELQEFRDIVWDLDLLESYRNLSFKMIRAFNWARIYFPNVHYIAKVDIDSFVFMENYINILIKKIQTSQRRVSIPIVLGNIYYKTEVIRDRSFKWYVGTEEIDREYYPTYAAGPNYIFTRLVLDIILTNYSRLYENSKCPADKIGHCKVMKTILTMEDAFVTGVLLENSKNLTFYDEDICLSRCEKRVHSGTISVVHLWYNFSHPIIICDRILNLMKKLP